MDGQHEAEAAPATAGMTVLVTQLGERRVALPLAHVVETMRPMPVEPVADAPPFVRGLGRIRGAAVPVLDGGLLVGERPAAATRLVLLQVGEGERTVALAVDGVLGVALLDGAALAATPPLVDDGRARLQAVGVRDQQLMLVLRTTRLVPDELWAQLQAAAR